MDLLVCLAIEFTPSRHPTLVYNTNGSRQHKIGDNWVGVEREFSTGIVIVEQVEIGANHRDYSGNECYCRQCFCQLFCDSSRFR